MPTSLAQLIMFVSSYAPLLIVFALLDTFGKGIPTVVCVALAALSGLALALVFRIARSINPRTAGLSDVRPRDSDAIAYVVTYLVPFIAIEGSTWRERAAVLVFFDCSPSSTCARGSSMSTRCLVLLATISLKPRWMGGQ